MIRSIALFVSFAAANVAAQPALPVGMVSDPCKGLTKAGIGPAVFIGDSITEPWGLDDPDLFSDGVVNRGISGQTSP